MSERDSRESDGQTRLEAPRSEAAPVSARRTPPGSDGELRLRSPARRDEPLATDADIEPQNRNAEDDARRSWPHRHPIAVAFGLLFLLLALPAGYLYWNYSSHFETTDDAYIAARQFAIAPEV
jgi:membrane fusion protein (multidrug efflux system)